MTNKMSDAPETIWIDAVGVPSCLRWAGTYYLDDDDDYLTFEYRRADLPADLVERVLKTKETDT